MNKNDLRYIKTEDILRKSFFQCVDECGFEKTTISMICKKARISRRTFYIHYEDKYHLLDKLYKELEKKIIDTYAKTNVQEMLDGQFYNAISWYISQLDNNREIVRILIKCSKQKFTNMVEHLFVDYPQSHKKGYFEKKNELSCALNVMYMVNGMVGFAEKWLERYEEMDKEEAIYLMTKFCYSSATLFLKSMEME